MPSPFPGMDPYLESPLLWKGFHTLLIGAIVSALNQSLPDGFQARAEERCYIVPPHRDIYADVSVAGLTANSPGGTAILTRAAPTGVATLSVHEEREKFVEILDLTSGGRVVTIIEVLSPANKASGSEGRRAYMRKQADLLRSETNFMEIDLLRDGAHTVMVPRAELDAAGPWNYCICLWRANDPARFPFWLNRLPDPLPEVRVPLTENWEQDTFLALQVAVDRAYRDGGYSRLLDYRTEPDPPLSESDATWAKELLT
jgi:hypothetical protein